MNKDDAPTGRLALSLTAETLAELIDLDPWVSVRAVSVNALTDTVTVVLEGHTLPRRLPGAEAYRVPAQLHSQEIDGQKWFRVVPSAS